MGHFSGCSFLKTPWTKNCTQSDFNYIDQSIRHAFNPHTATDWSFFKNDEVFIVNWYSDNNGQISAFINLIMDIKDLWRDVEDAFVNFFNPARISRKIIEIK